MYYDKIPILFQIFYWVNLIRLNCGIAEWLTTCKCSGSWQNEHVFSCFTVLVTVSKEILAFLPVSAVRNINSTNDNVRRGGGNGRGIIHD